jgi:hypothetical protein
MRKPHAVIPTQSSGRGAAITIQYHPSSTGSLALRRPWTRTNPTGALTPRKVADSSSSVRSASAAPAAASFATASDTITSSAVIASRSWWKLAEAVAASAACSAKPRRSAPLSMPKPVIPAQPSARGAANHHPVSSLIHRQPRPAETFDPNKPNRRADTAQSRGFFE